MKNKIISIISLFVILPAFSQAADFSYNFVDVEFAQIDDELLNVDIDGDIISLLGSFDITDNVNALVHYRTVDYDFNLDVDVLSIGVGYHQAINNTTDFHVSLALSDVELEIGSLSDDDTGPLLTVGVRSMLDKDFEGFAFVDYLDVFDDSDTTLNVGGRMYVNKDVSFSLAFATSSDATEIGIGARFNF